MKVKRGIVFVIMGLLLIAAALFLGISNIRDEIHADESVESVLAELAVRTAAGSPDGANFTAGAWGAALGVAGDTGSGALGATGGAAGAGGAGSGVGATGDGIDAAGVGGFGATGGGAAGAGAGAFGGGSGATGSAGAAGDLPLYVRYPKMDMPAVEIDGHRYIGRLEFPALELELPVMESWSYPNLKISPCRYSGSAYLGNLVIAAHNYRSHFSPVKQLPVGEEVYFTDMDGNVFHYEIAATEILEPTEIEKMIHGDDWDMTLFTCTYGGRTRFALRCKLIS